MSDIYIEPTATDGIKQEVLVVSMGPDALLLC
jgi:hypothetical protein